MSYAIGRITAGNCVGAKDDKTEPGAGGVQRDARGNGVWQWAVESGKQALDSTSRLLRRLEVPGLKLEGYTSERKGPGPGAAPAHGLALPRNRARLGNLPQERRLTLRFGSACFEGTERVDVIDAGVREPVLGGGGRDALGDAV